MNKKAEIIVDDTVRMIVVVMGLFILLGIIYVTITNWHTIIGYLK